MSVNSNSSPYWANLNTIGFMGNTYNAGTSELTYARQQFQSDLNSSGNSQLQCAWNQKTQDTNTLTSDLQNNNIDAFNAYARVQEDKAFGAPSAQKQADMTAFQNLLNPTETSEFQQVQSDAQTFASDLSGASAQTQSDYKSYVTQRNSALVAGFDAGTIPTTFPTNGSSGCDGDGNGNGYGNGNGNLQSMLMQILQMLLSGQNNQYPPTPVVPYNTAQSSNYNNYSNTQYNNQDISI